jgi:Mycothiol maleylpyruvate isomerase N-terminal domain
MTTRDTADAAADALATERDLPGEAESWAELHALIDRLTPETASVPGYFEEGWTAKDAVAHIGTWMAQGAQMLRRIAAGTYRDDDLDVDAANAEFLAAMKDVPLETVHLQVAAAHGELLAAWAQLPDVTPEAAAWVRKAGPAHVAEHLPRLAGWLDELDTGGRRTT